MPNEIYHRSEWGNPKPLGWGNIYFDADATNELYKRSDNYENSNGTDEILRDISNKASIVLTPTAYDNGSINSPVPTDGDGDFDFTRASVATRVNEKGLIEEVASGIPRIDYTSGFGSWLLEPESTNLFLNSANLSTQDVTTTATSFSVSFYGTGTITFSGTHTGTLTGTGVNERVSVTFTPTSGTLTCTVSGSVTNAQIENLSYSTSYIPTSGSTVTRSADVANNSGNADLFNDSEGVLYAEIAALADDLTNRVISISDSSNDNAVTLRFKNNTNQLNFQVRANDVAEIFRNITVSDITEFAKVAFKYKSGESSVFINGTEVVTMGQTFTFTNTLNQLRFESASTADDFYGKTKELAVFKEALTDLELESLTSWVSFTQMATDLEYTLE